MFGETFQCAEGFLHIGSGRPKVGVGEECAGAATYPLRTGLKVERGRGGLSGAGMGQDLPGFHKQQAKPGQEELASHTHTAAGGRGVKARLGPG